MNFSTLTPFLNGIGLVALAASLVYTQLRSGARTVSSEVVANYKALDEQQKEIITQKDAVISERDTTLGELKLALRKSGEDCIAQTSKLQGTIEQQEKTIFSQNQIITNKNPELVKILEQVVEGNKQIGAFMMRIDERFSKSEEILNTQTAMLESGQTRNQKIDEATAQEKGHVLRKP